MLRRRDKVVRHGLPGERDVDAAEFAIGDHHPGLAAHPLGAPRVAVVGLGYVGLPTALGLFGSGATVLGVDVSPARLRDIRDGNPDLLAEDRERLAGALREERFILTSDPTVLENADAVMICVPTPVDTHLDPDLEILRAACATVVHHAQPGQVIILTSTSYPGCTRELLAGPLRTRNLTPGEDIYVASSPERIDPANAAFPQHSVPRVVGGVTHECTVRAASLIRLVTANVHTVSSPEAAEMTKLVENSFRAVNIAFANEMADVARSLEVSIGEVIEAASTKPYGFMAFQPGTGVGGHCIPCDPHYLLWQLRANRIGAPILSEAMGAIARRPHEIVTQIVEALRMGGQGIRDARILIVGVAYKPDVRDTRGSPAIEILAELCDLGAHVEYHDPFVKSVGLDHNRVLLSVTKPNASAYDLVLVNTLHNETDYGWLHGARLLLDPSDRDRGENITPDVEREAITVNADRGSEGALSRVAEERAAFTIRR